MNIPLPRRATSVLGIACLSLFFAARNATAQSLASNATGTGTIAGRVSNVGTTEYLEGAVVTLDPGNVSTLTSVTGEFEFQRVSEGTYTVTVSYTGLETKSARVSIAAGARAVQEFQLTASIYQLDAFVVA